MSDDNTTSTTTAEDGASTPTLPRQVGFGLGMGILLVPLFFAWFLLREGYSSGARLVDFGWLAVSLMFAFAINVPIAIDTPISFSAPTTAASKPAAAAVPGEPIQVGPLALTFETPATRTSVGMAGFREPASDGGVLVVVRYTVRNTSNTPVEAFRIPEITLIDPSGTVYGPDAGKTGMYAMEADLNQKAWSDLKPGITTRSAQVFEIAEQSYDPATWRIVIGGHDVQVAMTR